MKNVLFVGKKLKEQLDFMVQKEHVENNVFAKHIKKVCKIKKLCYTKITTQKRN